MSDEILTVQDVLRQRKDERKKAKVLIVDASSVFRRGRAQNFVDPAHGAQIASWVQGFAGVEDRARVVDRAEIEKEGWTLNISRYVLPPIGADIPPLPEAVATFKDALAKCREAEDSYYELGPKAQLPVDAQGLEADRPEPTSDRPGSERDRLELTADRPESEADRPELPPNLAAAVKALGTRPRQGPLRDVITSLCSWRPLKPAELDSILGIRADNLTKRHLTEMVAEGRLRRLFPGEPTHPNQAYAAASDDDEKSPT